MVRWTIGTEQFEVETLLGAINKGVGTAFCFRSLQFAVISLFTCVRSACDLLEIGEIPRAIGQRWLVLLRVTAQGDSGSFYL
jgi:hypothetical protein